MFDQNYTSCNKSDGICDEIDQFAIAKLVSNFSSAFRFFGSISRKPQTQSVSERIDDTSQVSTLTARSTLSMMLKTSIFIIINGVTMQKSEKCNRSLAKAKYNFSLHMCSFCNTLLLFSCVDGVV
jgi:hypothetical protein